MLTLSALGHCVLPSLKSKDGHVRKLPRISSLFQLNNQPHQGHHLWEHKAHLHQENKVRKAALPPPCKTALSQWQRGHRLPETHPGDKQSHQGQTRLQYEVCKGKEQIFLRLFCDTAQGVGGNIESKRNASPYRHTAPYTSPGKQTASQMHRFPS